MERNEGERDGLAMVSLLRNAILRRGVVVAVLIAGLLTVGGTASSQGQSQDVDVRRSDRTGLAKLVRPLVGTALPVSATTSRGSSAPEAALRQYGHLFGVKDVDGELVLQDVRRDGIGHTHTRYLQYYRGVRVFAGVLKVHQNGDGGVVSLNGDFRPIPETLDTQPAFDTGQAIAIARDEFEAVDPTVETSQLVIVDPGWYGDPPTGPRLAYHIILADPSQFLRELLFVDAQSGEILDRWSLIETTGGTD